MNIVMDNVDGLKSLKMIRDYDSKALVIMCSAMGQEYMLVDALESGAKDFVVKPFTNERMIEAVKKAVR